LRRHHDHSSLARSGIPAALRDFGTDEAQKQVIKLERNPTNPV